ncbi:MULTISPECIES: hypothetical protein [unclassified Chryseobacterium]|uniref:hypothetical protein n=1 Tax=unclassified Chryseobacterium TaxID=2593645 RepID=UPI000E275418|nr:MULTISPECIES: hypothetical protein [unclassified Chryseobacterium]MCD0480378.1 hypothetical protein [Chryseobacterium sp. LC2016-29]REC40554.1 hypothetical protein DRF69_18265 [Chryseobacterium sp. 5_R23647]
MKELYQIHKKEKFNRLVMFTVIGGCLIFTAVVCIYAMMVLKEGKKNIYVMYNDSNLVRAHSTDINNSQDILMKKSIENLNQLLYQQFPNVDNVNGQLKRAVAISDNSVNGAINQLKNNNFYQNILSQGMYSLLLKDTIMIDYARKPASFEYRGKLKISKNELSVLRQIKTTGTIEYTGIVNNVSDGYIIRNFNIVEDKPIDQK